MTGVKGAILMDLLLGLAGLAGLSSFLQSKTVPSEADFQKAVISLATKPDDPAANLIAGKYLVFALGDFPIGLEHLAKGSDKTLAALAKKELDPANTDNPEKQVGMGDEWVIAAKKFPALTTQFYDHASEWYAKAWPQLSDLWKMKVREQGKKLATSRPPGGPRKGLPSGWKSSMGSPILDGSISRVGSYSIKLPTSKKTETFLNSDQYQLTGQNIEYSAWVRSDGTDSKNDVVTLNFFDRNGRFIGESGTKITPDRPFWIKVSGKGAPIPDAVFVSLVVAIRSGEGIAWADDFSLKVDGKEILKNYSFEER